MFNKVKNKCTYMEVFYNKVFNITSNDIENLKTRSAILLWC